MSEGQSIVVVMQWAKPYLPAAAFFLFDKGLQVSGYVNAPLSVFLIALGVLCLTIPAYEPASRVYNGWSGPRPVTRSLIGLGLLAAFGSAMITWAVWAAPEPRPTLTSLGYAVVFLGAALALFVAWVVIGALWIAPRTLHIRDDIFDPPPTAPPRQLSAYEVEKKLKAIDENLALLGGVRWPIEYDGRDLIGDGLGALSDPERTSGYRERLQSYLTDVVTLKADLAILRDANEQYQDVVTAMTVPSHVNWSAAVHFARCFDALLRSAPNCGRDDYYVLMGLPIRDFEIWVNAIGSWKNTAKTSLVELHQRLSK